LTNYYFAPVNTPGTALPGNESTAQIYPLPALPGFSNTNRTGPLITSVGTPTVVGGWARFAIQGTASKFAYLGQYYRTNAFVMTNGVVTTNTTGIVSPYGDFFPTAPGEVAMITMPDINTGAQGTGVVRVISLNVDANHDGTMDFTYGGPDQTSPARPFRFWVNDDKGDGDFGGNGIPGQGNNGDGLTMSGRDQNEQPVYKIQGRRDLIDFFPVCFNLSSLFQSNSISAGVNLADTNYQYVLSQADSALRFAYTSLTPTNYMAFLRDTNVSGSLANFYLTTVSNTGTTLPTGFLIGASGNQNILLMEAVAPTTQPLVLSIFHGTNLIAQTQLYLSISGVEQMFRHKNLLLNISPAVPDRTADVSVPNEPDTTNKNFIFLHGYNVNPTQARGWDSDFFKRMYWSGSHAKFYAITWEASDSQWFDQVTINLQTNIVNAFLTAPKIASFIGSLPGQNVVAAHSLGNMAMLATLNDSTNIPFSVNTYCMIDAAVAIEALQGNAVPDVNMIDPAWIPYANRLYATYWCQFFPTNDFRSKLSWNNRLASAANNTTLYNFYSSGEEVLREFTNGVPPSELLGSADEVGYFIEDEVGIFGKPVGCFTWAWQELLKGQGTFDGVLSSSHGGWKFNDASYGTNSILNSSVFTHMSPTAAASLTSAQLQTNAFFDVTSFNGSFPVGWTQDLQLYGSTGPGYAKTNWNRILSDAIPCVTLPAGANPIPALSPLHRNFDMQGVLENGWPSGRPALNYGTPAAGEWHHSDCRAIAYTFTHSLFDDIVQFGNLQ